MPVSIKVPALLSVEVSHPVSVVVSLPIVAPVSVLFELAVSVPASLPLVVPPVFPVSSFSTLSIPRNNIYYKSQGPSLSALSISR